MNEPPGLRAGLGFMWREAQMEVAESAGGPFQFELLLAAGSHRFLAAGAASRRECLLRLHESKKIHSY